MQLTKSLVVLAISLIPVAFCSQPTPASKYPHGITEDGAAVELKPRIPVGPAHHFYGKRQATNSTITTTTDAPETTEPPNTTRKSNLTTSSLITTTFTDEDGDIQTVTSTWVVVPTGDIDPDQTSTGPPGLQTDGGAAEARAGWGGVAAAAGMAAWWVL